MISVFVWMMAMEASVYGTADSDLSLFLVGNPFVASDCTLMMTLWILCDLKLLGVGQGHV